MFKSRNYDLYYHQYIKDEAKIIRICDNKITVGFKILFSKFITNLKFINNFQGEKECHHDVSQ